MISKRRQLLIWVISLIVIMVFLGISLVLSPQVDGLVHPVPNMPSPEEHDPYTVNNTETFTVHQYFPLIALDYAPFSNGNFETGDLTGWDTCQGSFGGLGSGLLSAVVWNDDNWSAQLGDSSAQHEELPVGYGCIVQTFTVNSRYLHIWYRILTSDIIKGETSMLYIDTFEVSLNRSPNEIDDDERNNKKCDTTILNPTGILIASDGLVFCGGHHGPQDHVGTLRDLEWKRVTLDLQDFQGNVSIYFTLWSREYEFPHYHDQGLYNTWVYIDDIQHTNSPDPIPTPTPTPTPTPVPPLIASVANLERGSKLYTLQIENTTQDRIFSTGLGDLSFSDDLGNLYEPDCLAILKAGGTCLGVNIPPNTNIELDGILLHPVSIDADTATLTLEVQPIVPFDFRYYIIWQQSIP